eukprot:TRINITY_DN7629_c0_g3_i1.p1 TRINITY_DN7629_c0_g3~~TRINITY_DN7629_c0_g3_i1.p1  ORF type:complete len:196 (-),score=25.48 TRINITY_DN7629_c0_g3_i1:182-769(-)
MASCSRDVAAASEGDEALTFARDGIEWRHVIVKDAKPGNQPKVECLYCFKTFFGGATRIRAHIIGDRPNRGVSKCPSPSPMAYGELSRVQSEKYEASAKRQKIAKLNAMDRLNLANKLGGKQSTLSLRFRSANKEIVDAAWAHAFYGKGLPFSVADDKLFKEAIRLTCNRPFVWASICLSVSQKLARQRSSYCSS